MKTTKNWLDIALRGIVFIYLPVAVLFYGSYRSIFNMDPGIHWLFILLYLFVFLRWLIDKYRYQTIDLEVQSFDDLDRLIEQGRFEVIDKNRTELTVRPTFDVPFNLILNDRITLSRSNDEVIIEGPRHYVTILDKNIRGEESFWTRKSVGSLKFIYLAVIMLVPVVTESNLVWSMNVLRHNTTSNVREDVRAVSETLSGNSLENAVNGGLAVETDDDIFYIEDGLNIVRSDKEFEHKEYLLQHDGGHDLMDLNIVEEWLYFTKGDSLERIKRDGSEHSTLYSLSHPSEMQIQGNWIYFSAWQDDNNIYRMDLNGQNLEQLIDVQTYQFSIHGERLLVSYKKSGQHVVESYDLNGEDPKIVLDAYAENLMVWDDYYYYLGEEHALYRSKIGEESEPERLLDAHVSSYMPTDEGIVYSVYSSKNNFAREGLYMMSHEGEEETLLSASKNVEGLAKVGDTVLFTSEEGYRDFKLKQLDLNSGRIDVLD